MALLSRLLPLLRCAFPGARFLVRLDSGFATPEVLRFPRCLPAARLRRLDAEERRAGAARRTRHDAGAGTQRAERSNRARRRRDPLCGRLEEAATACRDQGRSRPTLGDAIAQPRLNSLLLWAFAGVALVLWAVGVYGISAQRVSQRRREFAIRLALFASPASVFGMVTRESLAIGAIGVMAGLCGRGTPWRCALARPLRSGRERCRDACERRVCRARRRVACRLATGREGGRRRPDDDPADRVGRRPSVFRSRSRRWRASAAHWRSRAPHRRKPEDRIGAA